MAADMNTVLRLLAQSDPRLVQQQREALAQTPSYTAANDRIANGFVEGMASSVDTMQAGTNAIRAWMSESDADMNRYLDQAKFYNDLAASRTNDSFSQMLGQTVGDLALTAPVGVMTGGAVNPITAKIATTGLRSLANLGATTAGMAAASFPTSYNESVNTQFEHGVEPRRALDDAMTPALVNAGLENLAFVPAIARVARGKAPSTGDVPTNLADAGVNTLRAGAVEGATGGAQFMSNLAGVNEADRNYGLLSKEALDGMLQAAYDEARVGGTIAGGLNLASMPLADRPTADNNSPSMPPAPEADASGFYNPPTPFTPGPDWRYGNSGNDALTGELMPKQDSIGFDRQTLEQSPIDGQFYEQRALGGQPNTVRLEQTPLSGELMPEQQGIGADRQLLEAAPIDGQFAEQQSIGGQTNRRLGTTVDGQSSSATLQPTPALPSPLAGQLSIPMPPPVQMAQPATKQTAPAIPMPPPVQAVRPTVAPVQAVQPTTQPAPQAPIAENKISTIAPKAPAIPMPPPVQAVQPTAAPVQAVRPTVAPVQAVQPTVAPVRAVQPTTQLSQQAPNAENKISAITPKVNTSNFVGQLAARLGLTKDDPADVAYLESILMDKEYMDEDGNIELYGDTPENALSEVEALAKEGYGSVKPVATYLRNKRIASKTRSIEPDDTMDDEPVVATRDKATVTKAFDSLDADTQQRILEVLPKTGSLRNAVMSTDTLGNMASMLNTMTKGVAAKKAKAILDILQPSLDALTADAADPELLARAAAELEANTRLKASMPNNTERMEQMDAEQRGRKVDKTTAKPSTLDPIVSSADDAPLFSRVTRTVDPASPKANMKDLGRILAAIRRKLPKFPEPIVLGSILNAPKELQNEFAEARKQNKVTHGFYYQGNVYLTPDAFENVETLEATLLHEGTHLGLFNAWNGELTEHLLNLIKDIGGYETIVRMAKNAGFGQTLAGYFAKYEADLVGKTGAERRQQELLNAFYLLHEVIANSEEKSNIPATLFRRVALAVSKALRSVGAVRLANWFTKAVPTLLIPELAAISRRQLAEGNNSSSARRVNNSILPNRALPKETQAEQPMTLALQQKMRKLPEAIKKIWNSPQATVAAAMTIAPVYNIVARFSQPIADKLLRMAQTADRRFNQYNNKFASILAQGSDDDQKEALKTFMWQTPTDKAAEVLTKEQFAIFKQLRELTNQIMDEMVRPVQMAKFNAAVESRRAEDGTISAQKFATQVGKFFKPLVDDNGKRLETKATVAYAMDVDNGSMRRVDITDPNATHILAVEMDDFAPRLWNFDALTDMHQFAKDMVERGVAEDEKDGLRLHAAITKDRTSTVTQAHAIDTPDSHLKQRKIRMSNFAARGYIDVSPQAFSVYLHQMTLHAEFVDKFGPFQVGYDQRAQGYSVHLSKGSELADLANAVEHVDERDALLRSIAHALREDLGAGMGHGFRPVTAWIGAATSALLMFAIVPMSMTEAALPGSAQHTAEARKIANRAVRGAFINEVKKLIGKGDPSYVEMQARFETMGYLASRMADDINTQLTDLAQTQGTEGKANTFRNKVYRNFGAHWFTRVMMTAAAKASDELLMHHVRILDNPDASVDDRAKANAELARFDITAEELKRWDAIGRPVFHDDMDENERRLTQRVSDAMINYQRVMIPKPNSVTETLWAKNPILGSMIYLFKGYFFAAGVQVLPRFFNNKKADGTTDIFGTLGQVGHLAITGFALSAVGLFAAHSLKYGIPAGIFELQQPPFSLLNPDMPMSDKFIDLMSSSFQALTGLYPFYSALGRPEGLLDISNLAVPVGLMEKMYDATTDVDKAQKLAIQLGEAMTLYSLGGAVNRYREKALTEKQQ